MEIVYYSKQEKILLNTAVLLILIASGSQAFYRFHVSITLLFFLLFSVFFYIHYPYKSNIRSLPFVNYYCLYILFNFFVLNSNHTDSLRVVPYVVFAVGSFLILSKISWPVLVDRLIVIVGYLAAISIVVFVIGELNIISPRIVDYNGVGVFMLFFHVIGWEEPFHRLAGIYWEPGAYQIVLNSTLLIAINFLFDKPKAEIKGYYKYLLLIFVGSILTFSTTGYVILFIIAVYYFYLKYKFNKQGNLNVFRLSFIIACVASVAYFVFMSAPIQKKMSQLESGGYNSTMVRQADNLALIQMIAEKPIFGYGLASKEFNKRSEQLDNITSSNGDLFFAANFGLPFFLLVMMFCYIKAKALNLPPFFNVILFFMLNIGECFLYYPFVFIFLIHSGEDAELINS